MAETHRQHRARIFSVAVPPLVVLGLASACHPSTTPATSGAAATSGIASAADCQAVSAVLDNGPDPSVDPVGYAEAQPGPLRAIQTSDTALKAALSQLAAAYTGFFQANGAAGEQPPVDAATRKLEALCPGVAS